MGKRGRSNSSEPISEKEMEVILRNIRNGIKEWMKECKGKSALSVLNAIFARVSCKQPAFT